MIGLEFSRLLSTGVLAYLALGCVSSRSARVAHPIDAVGGVSKHEVGASGLRVSGAELGELASPHFGVLELTFENTSSDWVRIRRVGLNFGEPGNSLLRVPWGEELRSWYDATLQRNAIRNTNRDLALGAVALTGMVLQGASNDDTGRAIGGLAVIGATATAIALDVDQSVRAAGDVAIFPDTHLLSGAFSVPPSLFVKKWILLNTLPARVPPCIDRVVLRYELENRPAEQVYLQYKAATDWQRAACRSRTTPYAGSP